MSEPCEICGRPVSKHDPGFGICDHCKARIRLRDGAIERGRLEKTAHSRTRGEAMPKSKIKCLWLEPTEYMQLSLRRYKGVPSGQPLCEMSGMGYHNADAVIVPQMPRSEEYPNGCGLLEHPDYPRTDPRWPKACPCGYEFQEDDSWQINMTLLFSNPELNGLTTIKDAPVGAMWDAWWYTHKGPDGRCLVVKTPGGDWIIDYPCKDGKGWQRTGEPPIITARPSIGIGGDPGGRWKYHGFLTDGYLEEC